MRPVLGLLLVAAGVTVAVGILSGGDWPGFVVGAVLSLALWVMLFAGGYGRPERPVRVQPLPYLTSAALGVALGYVFYRVGDENGAWWAVGFILAGSILPATTAARRDDHKA